MARRSLSGRNCRFGVRFWITPPPDDRALATCPIWFQAQWEDAETGLYYNRFRYYDLDATQYPSPDPIGLEGGSRPQAYAADPNSWIDPLGLAGCPEQVSFENTDLSQAVISTRINDGNFNAPHTNYAAARITRSGKTTDIIVRCSRDVMHAVEVIIRETYPHTKINGIYSERIPCTNCAAQIRRVTLEAEVTYTAPYNHEGKSHLQNLPGSGLIANKCRERPE